MGYQVNDFEWRNQTLNILWKPGTCIPDIIIIDTKEKKFFSLKEQERKEERKERKEERKWDDLSDKVEDFIPNQVEDLLMINESKYKESKSKFLLKLTKINQIDEVYNQQNIRNSDAYYAYVIEAYQKVNVAYNFNGDDEKIIRSKKLNLEWERNEHVLRGLSIISEKNTRITKSYLKKKFINTEVKDAKDDDHTFAKMYKEVNF